MKAWNKPIRLHYCRSDSILTKNGFEPFNPWKKEDWGVTSWMVGTCTYPWSPWVQVSLGRISIQIKWYVIVGLLCVSSFISGLLI